MPDLSTRESRRALIADAYQHGIERVAPDAAVQAVLRRVDDGVTIEGELVPVAGRLIVVAIGKAAPTMARAAQAVLGDRVDAGYVLTKDGHLGDPVPGFVAWEASHPVPDERGIEATRAILDAVTELTADDVVIALISGGGSALFEAPKDGLTLADIQQTTELLLRAGAPIQHLNAVRSEMSQVKGGGLRRRIGAARTVSLILSDVLGNPPDIIASGPTVLALRILSARVRSSSAMTCSIEFRELSRRAFSNQRAPVTVLVLRRGLGTCIGSSATTSVSSRPFSSISRMLVFAWSELGESERARHVSKHAFGWMLLLNRPPMLSSVEAS